MKYRIKKDKYKSTRGGYSRVINVKCRKCDNVIATYQKDGPGNLRRMYLDRIFSPTELIDLQYRELKDIKPLICSKCNELIAVPYLYEKEKRKAYKVFQDAIIKELIKNQ